jgi:cytochrome d ubiquinol oxidase subunit I
MGRQPWLVQGVMSTKEAVADVPAAMVASTLAAYLVVYVLLLGAYIAVIFYLARRASRGQPLGPVSQQSARAEAIVAAE